MTTSSVIEKRFVFRDGDLAYDCAACNAKCCRHGDFIVSAQRELIQLGRIAPRVWPFLSCFHSDTLVSGTSFYPQCWFLDSEGRCALHVGGGISVKPLNCLLFPANDLVIVGDICYVDIALTCPLGLADKEGVSGEVLTHDAVNTILALAPGLDALGPRTYAPTSPDWNTRMQLGLSKLHAQRRLPPSLSAWTEILCFSFELPVPAQVSARIEALHLLFASEPFVLPARLETFLWALAPSLLFKLMAASSHSWSFARAAQHAVDVMIAFRFLLEAASALARTDVPCGLVPDLFRRNHSLLSTLAVLHLPVRVNDTAARTFHAPEHMLAVARELALLVERDEGASILDHLRTLSLPSSQVRGVIDMIAYNRDCFHFGLE